MQIPRPYPASGESETLGDEAQQFVLRSPPGEPDEHWGWSTSFLKRNRACENHVGRLPSIPNSLEDEPWRGDMQFADYGVLDIPSKVFEIKSLTETWVCTDVRRFFGVDWRKGFPHLSCSDFQRQPLRSFPLTPEHGVRTGKFCPGSSIKLIVWPLSVFVSLF